MAFCNFCGASLADGTRFCSKCGAAITEAAAVGSPTPGTTATPAKKPSSGLKTILIVVGVIVVIGILGIVSISLIAYRVARSSHYTQNGNDVKVETPFGTVETSKDPEKAAKNLGVDIYPGAEVQSDGASSATFGGIRTVAASFESKDSAQKVCDFYKSRFPNATVSSSDQNRCSIVSNAPPNMITINVEAENDQTKFQITNVNKKASASQ